MKFILIIMLITFICGNVNYGDINDISASKEYDRDFSIISGLDSKTPEPKENKFKYNPEYVDEHMPESYSITYVFEHGREKDIHTLTVTPEGCYKVYNDTEQLYIKNSSGTYNSYHKEDNGVFKKINIEHDAETIDAWTGSIEQFTLAYKFGPQDYELIGKEKVAGVECEVYEDVSGKYYIEPNTGICLKNNDEISSYNFECTEFKTESITLPEHD